VAVEVGETLVVPLVAFDPDQPLLAVQEVALVDDQVRVEEFPEVMEVGEAPKVTVGTGSAGGVEETLMVML